MIFKKLENIYKSSAVVSAWTLISRVLGFVRDILFAFFLGSGPVADAFIIAFRIPNLFRRFFAEGVFSAAFIPLLSEANEKFGKKAGIKFTSKIASLLLFIVLPIIILSEFFMPQIVLIIAPGFADNLERLELTIPYARIIFPYLIFIIFTALFAASLNTNGKFWAGAAAPSILNVFIITGLIFSRFLDYEYGIVISWSVLIAGIFQMLLVSYTNYKQGLAFNIGFPSIDENIKTFVRKFIPAAMGAGVTQINLLIASIFASQIPGAVSWLYYSDRVAQLPLGIIAIAIGTVLLPDLSKKVNSSQKLEQNIVQDRAILLTLIFSFPAAVALIYLSELIIRTLFGYGAFTEGDIIKTSNALKVYAYAIPAFMFIKILSPIFFARKDTKTPLQVAAFSAVLNVFLCWYLMDKIGYIGIAMSLSISGYVNFVLLVFILLKRKLYFFTKNFYLMLIKIISATLSLLILLFIVNSIMTNLILNYDPIFLNIFKLSILVLVGVLSFIYICYLMKVFNFFKKDSFIESYK